MTIPEAERMWAALLRTHATFVPKFDAELKAATGLPLAWYDVLLELHASGGALRMTDLSERVVLSRTRVSRIVSDMESAGLVVRDTNPEDGRSSFAKLTTAGSECFRVASRIYPDCIRRAFSGVVDGGDLRITADTLERILSSRATP
jgi:DNA-binding MarR family transcriptional regulator